MQNLISQNFRRLVHFARKPKVYLRIFILIMAVIVFQSQPILAGKSYFPGILMALSSYVSGELYLSQKKFKGIFRLTLWLFIYLLFLLVLELPFLWVHNFSYPSLGINTISFAIWMLSCNPLIKEMTGEKIVHPHPSFRFYSISFLFFVFFIYFFFADKLNIPQILGFIIPEQLKSISYPPQFVIIIGFVSAFVFILTLAGTLKIEQGKRAELMSISQKFLISALLLLFFEGFNFILNQNLIVNPDVFIFEQPFISYGLMYWGSIFCFLSSVLLVCLGLVDFILLLGTLYENKSKTVLFQPGLIDEKKVVKEALDLGNKVRGK